MLRPGDILENLEKLSSVARDAVDHMMTLRGLNGEMPDLEGEIPKYVAECKFFKALLNDQIFTPWFSRFICIEFQWLKEKCVEYANERTDDIIYTQPNITSSI